MPYAPVPPRPMPEAEVEYQRATSEAMARLSAHDPETAPFRAEQSAWGRWVLLLGGALGCVLVILLMWALGIL